MHVKRLLNKSEEVTNERLCEVCAKYGAHISPKIRVADILPVENSGIDDSHYEYALKSHFDFVVSDEAHFPVFAVEFDGPVHGDDVQRARDEKKNRLCERFEFPLLRVNANYLEKEYRGMTLLTWFVEVWYAKQAFDAAQENGQIPLDEPFMPWGMAGIPERKNTFPLWLSANVRLKIQEYRLNGRVLDMMPSLLIGMDGNGNYRAIAFLRIDEETGVFTKTGMRTQRFPVAESEALDEIVVCELYEALKETLNGDRDPTSRAKIEEGIREFEGAVSIVRAAYCGGSYPIQGPK
jgi:hypothetical protein